MNLDAPTRKAGVVFLRNLDSKDPEVLLVRPKPKNKGETPKLVLPRGSRQYWQLDSETGRKEWCDARDDNTARKHAGQLEPFTRTLLREAWEETGMSRHLLRQQAVHEMGPLMFQSTDPRKGSYPIHWFVSALTVEAVRYLDQHAAPDITEKCWLTLSEIKAMAADGKVSPGYVNVVEEAIAQMHDQTMPIVQLTVGPEENRKVAPRQI